MTEKRYQVLQDVPAKQFSFNGYPGVRIFSTRNDGKVSKDQFKLTDGWVDAFKGLNTDRAWQYLITPTAGVMYATWIEKVLIWINGKLKRVNKVMPRYQSEGFFTNIVVGEEVTVQKKRGKTIQNITLVRIKTLSFQAGPPDPALINYETFPWLVHLFTVERSDGSIVGPPADGDPVYVYLVSDQPIYVDRSCLKEL